MIVGALDAVGVDVGVLVGAEVGVNVGVSDAVDVAVGIDVGVVVGIGNGGNPTTSTGVWRSVVVPSPNCPDVLRPQHLTPPPLSSAQV